MNDESSERTIQGEARIRFTLSEIDDKRTKLEMIQEFDVEPSDFGKKDKSLGVYV